MPRARGKKDETQVDRTHDVADASSEEEDASAVLGARLVDAVAAKVLEKVDIEALCANVVEAVASRVAPHTLERLSLDNLTSRLVARLAAELQERAGG